MDACASIPTVDEPVDRFDRRLGAGTGPLGGGPPGSALRGSSIVGGQSGPRRGVCGRQSNRFVISQETRTPIVQWGGSRPSGRRTRRSEVAQPKAASVSNTSRGVPLRSSPEASASAEAATSSGTEITRRLLMEETRVLSRSDSRRKVTSAPRDMPPLRARRLYLRRRGKGACSEGPPRGESAGLVQTRSCPRSTDQTFARLFDWTSGPSCTWSKRRSRP